MSPAADRFPRVKQLDADDMARALFEQTQVRLTAEGPCAGGQVGTSYVRWPDGHPGVLKWRPHITVQELRDGPLAVADQLRRAGYPAPATELTAQVGHAVVMVQELLPDTKIDHLDARHFDRVTEVHRLQANALEDRGGIPAYQLYLQGVWEVVPTRRPPQNVWGVWGVVSDPGPGLTRDSADAVEVVFLPACRPGPVPGTRRRLPV